MIFINLNSINKFGHKKVFLIIFIFILIICVLHLSFLLFRGNINRKTETQDYGAYNYWCNITNKNTDDLNLIIKWCKHNCNCTYISVNSNQIYIEPNNPKTKETIYSNKDTVTIAEVLSKLNLSVINNWETKKEIVFLSKFNYKELNGNFCLTYTDKTLAKKSENFKKVAKNLYSSVIFYE